VVASQSARLTVSCDLNISGCVCRPTAPSWMHPRNQSGGCSTVSRCRSASIRPPQTERAVGHQNRDGLPLLLQSEGYLPIGHGPPVSPTQAGVHLPFPDGGHWTTSSIIFLRDFSVGLIPAIFLSVGGVTRLIMVDRGVIEGETQGGVRAMKIKNSNKTISQLKSSRSRFYPVL